MVIGISGVCSFPVPSAAAWISCRMVTVPSSFDVVRPRVCSRTSNDGPHWRGYRGNRPTFTVLSGECVISKTNGTTSPNFNSVPSSTSASNVMCTSGLDSCAHTAPGAVPLAIAATPAATSSQRARAPKPSLPGQLHPTRTARRQSIFPVIAIAFASDS